MDKVFVDTDVMIDFLTDRQPFSQEASLIFDLAEKGKISIFISSLSINNIYYLTRKLVGDKKAREIIYDLLEMVQIQEIGKDEIVEAIDSPMTDFEDAIQHASACRIENVRAIISRNTKDYKKSKLAVFTPEIFLKSTTF